MWARRWFAPLFCCSDSKNIFTGSVFLPVDVVVSALNRHPICSDVRNDALPVAYFCFPKVTENQTLPSEVKDAWVSDTTRPSQEQLKCLNKMKQMPNRNSRLWSKAGLVLYLMSDEHANDNFINFHVQFWP